MADTPFIGDLNDEEEEALIVLLHKLLPPTVVQEIERTSADTNQRWSELIKYALSIHTDWEHIRSVFKRSEDYAALREVKDILNEGGGGE